MSFAWLALERLKGRSKFFVNFYIWKPFKRKLFSLLNYAQSLVFRSESKVLSDQDRVETFAMVTVGTIHSVYKEKFGTPRQGNLVPHGRGTLVLDKRAVDVQFSLDALDQFSHLWLIFVFHTNTNQIGKKTPTSKVRPPQGAGAKIGVYATRSPHRPNPIGLSMARLLSVDSAKGVIELEGLDLCEGTPILDIKPYCEHVDWPGLDVAVTAKWVVNPKFERADVTFTNEALDSLKLLVDERQICQWYKRGDSDMVKQAITELISLDPRDLNRGRGVFVSEESTEPVAVKETSFTRRESKIRGVAAARPIYVRFDELNITFKPDDQLRGFQVLEISEYSTAQRNLTDRTKNGS